MSEIILCCGKICSGKSTFAKYLEKEYKYFNFSADEWMLKLFDETSDRSIFDKNHKNYIELIFSISEKLLKNQHNVVLDFGFWNKAERIKQYQHFQDLNFKIVLIYFPISFEDQVKNMVKRQNTSDLNHYTFTENSIIELNRLFEEPDDEAYINIYDYCKMNSITYIVG
jgi:predicted kinase